MSIRRVRIPARNGNPKIEENTGSDLFHGNGDDSAFQAEPVGNRADKDLGVERIEQNLEDRVKGRQAGGNRDGYRARLKTGDEPDPSGPRGSGENPRDQHQRRESQLYPSEADASPNGILRQRSTEFLLCKVESALVKFPTGG